MIQSYSKALEDASLSPALRKQYLETVNHASVQLSSMVSSILMLNKLEHREIYPEPQTYLLSEQLRQCALAYMDSWEKKDITFSIDVQDVRVCTQKELLEVVWNNLLANAIKYTNPGGSIAVASALQGNNVRISVKDTGIGMSEEVQAHIFDKFYQGDPSRASEGTGLGLALVKEILRITGAQILVESEVGKGSCFTVILPFISH